MDLFANDPTVNLLPGDGCAHYLGRQYSEPEANRFLECLMREIAWAADEVVLFGKRIVTARKVAWHADRPLPYRYSGSCKTALPWTATLAELKRQVETASGAVYNACLLNLYHHGEEGMGWHSDDESSLVTESAIASLSFGAERVFRFKHKRKPLTASVSLENGSLLVMKGATQQNWLHSLPKSKKITTPRVNLTFRLMVTS